MQSPVHHTLHPSLEFFHVVDALGLDELGPGGGFFRQPADANFKGIGEGVFIGPENIVLHADAIAELRDAEHKDWSCSILFSIPHLTTIPPRFT